MLLLFRSFTVLSSKMQRVINDVEPDIYYVRTSIVFEDKCIMTTNHYKQYCEFEQLSYSKQLFILFNNSFTFNDL